MLEGPGPGPVAFQRTPPGPPCPARRRRVPRPLLPSPVPVDLPPFPGFTPAGLAFLRDLKANNDREWFKPRKAVYEDELRWPLTCFVAGFLAEARRRGLPLTGSPEKNLFRIYRDTRFSKDKRPYKTHVSAWLTPSGEREAPGGFYVHVEPGAVYLAQGFWQPEGPLLRRIRARFLEDDGLAADLAARLARHGATFETDETLKRLPRGFEAAAGTAAEPVVKWKSFLAFRRLPDDAALAPSLVDEAAAFAEAARPVLDLGRE